MKCRAMTRIMHICMVLVVLVSVFFYAPMEAHAAVNLTGTGSYASSTGRYFTVFKKDMGNFVPSTGLSGIESDAFYQVKITTDISITSSQSINFNNISCTFGNFYAGYIGTVEASKSASSSTARTFYMKGSELLTTYGTNLRGTIFVKSGSLDTDLNMSVKFTVNSCVKQSVDAEEEYNKGYNAGYSAGEDAGYDSGYSTGYNAGYSAGQSSDAYNEGFQDGVDSVDTDSYYQSGYEAGENAGYDSGYEAGVDSVDTQSYYDAGYQAGYQEAYDLGYDTGYEEAYDVAYDAGYDAAMAEIEQWGADITNYPLKLVQGSGPSSFVFNVKTSSPLQYECSIPWTISDFVFDPNHTYKIHVNPKSYSVSSTDAFCLEDNLFYLEIGGISYKLSFFDDADVNMFFIPGDRFSNSLSFTWKPFCAMYGDEVTSSTVICSFDYSFSVWDMGPTGDTQNHIANQTDKLNENADKNTNTVINGFDSSGGQAVNDDFKASVNDYHTAEDSLFTTAKSGLEDFTFIDFTSITGMVTALSFVTSIMTSIYMAMGGDTGASGIILAVLFSVMLVSMAIGLYRYYVSNGKSGGSNKGGD